LFKRRKSIQNKQIFYSVIIEAGEIILVGLFFIISKKYLGATYHSGLVLYLQGFQNYNQAPRVLTALVQLFQHRMFVNHLFLF
jgi:ATP-binding cassette subfamily B protein